MFFKHGQTTICNVQHVRRDKVPPQIHPQKTQTDTLCMQVFGANSRKVTQRHVYIFFNFFYLLEKMYWTSGAVIATILPVPDQI